MSTLDDLRRTLESHSRELPSSDARTVAVHRRIRRIRRQRAAAAVSAVVGVLVVGLLCTGVVHVGSTDSAASSSAVPEYLGGGRLVTSLRLDTAATSQVTADYRVTSMDEIIGDVRCTSSSSPDIHVLVEINGFPARGSSCADGTREPFDAGSQGITAVGQRAVFSLRLVHDSDGSTVSATERARLPHAAVTASLYAAVPRAHYVFPPRPKHLASLGLTKHREDGASWMSGADDERVDSGVEITGGLFVTAEHVAPGVLTVQVDGHTLWTISSWDYRDGNVNYSVTHEDLVRLGITGSTARLKVTGVGFPTDVVSWAVLYRAAT